MRLNELSFENNTNQTSRKRKGRGVGSGLGKTCGKGHKGQKSRSGVAIKGFEGGQMPIHRRLPKRGFNNIFKTTYHVVNLNDIERLLAEKKIDSKKLINAEVLLENSLIRNLNNPIKLLSKGDITTAINIEVDAASKSAVEKINSVKGKITIITQPN